MPLFAFDFWNHAAQRGGEVRGDSVLLGRLIVSGEFAALNDAGHRFVVRG
jgi:hypothetical protein